MLKVVTGDDIAIPVTLKKDGAVVPIDAGATVRAAFISPSHSELLSSVVTVSSATPGSDWAHGLIVVVMTAADTTSLSHQNVKLEIEVDDGGKTTWFTDGDDIKIIAGLIQ